MMPLLGWACVLQSLQDGLWVGISHHNPRPGSCGLHKWLFKKMPCPSGIPESRYPANTGKKTPLQVNIAVSK